LTQYDASNQQVRLEIVLRGIAPDAANQGAALTTAASSPPIDSTNEKAAPEGAASSCFLVSPTAPTVA